jgi:predicted RNA methylase
MTDTAQQSPGSNKEAEAEERRTFLERAVRRGYMAWNALNEIVLGVETEYSVSGVGARMPGIQGVETDRSRYRDNVRYAPLDYVRLRRMMDLLAPGVDDVFYDLGSGRGRILCTAARHRMKRVVGIELFEELCVSARENAARVRGRQTPVDVICADVVTVDYSDGTIFTLHLPFGEATTRAVLQVIRDSLRTNPRNIRIGYAHPLYEYVFAEASWLEKYASFRPTDATNKNFWRSVSFWRNKSAL